MHLPAQPIPHPIPQPTEHEVVPWPPDPPTVQDGAQPQFNGGPPPVPGSNTSVQYDAGQLDILV